MLRILFLSIILLVSTAEAKYWNGSAWVDTVAKRYNGSAWVDVTEWRYDGSTWVQINTGGGGGTEPATGTVILGSTTTTAYTESWYVPLSFEEQYNETALTATWAESASTTTLSKLGIYVRGNAGGNCKMVLRTSALALVAVSDVKAFDYEENLSLQEFNFSTPPTVTKGTSYIPTIICDTDYAVVTGLLATGTDLDYGVNGSYASPAATLTGTTYAFPGIGVIYGKH